MRRIVWALQELFTRSKNKIRHFLVPSFSLRTPTLPESQTVPAERFELHAESTDCRIAMIDISCDKECI